MSKEYLAQQVDTDASMTLAAPQFHQTRQLREISWTRQNFAEGVYILVVIKRKLKPSCLPNSSTYRSCTRSRVAQRQRSHHVTHADTSHRLGSTACQEMMVISAFPSRARQVSQVSLDDTRNYNVLRGGRKREREGRAWRSWNYPRSSVIN